MWDNSRWNGVTTTADCLVHTLLNIEIDGGSHAMTVQNANTANATWQFRNVTDLTIDLPTALTYRISYY